MCETTESPLYPSPSLNFKASKLQGSKNRSPRCDYQIMDANVINHGQSQAADNDINGAQVTEQDTAQVEVTSKRCRKNNKASNLEVDDDCDDPHALIACQFSSYLEEEYSSVCKNEVDKYLGDYCEGAKNMTFDILAWWKANSSKYPALSQLACDVLAMPISTVASESSFSTGGRILDPFRSSLSPMMVEVLVCAQNWLRSSLQNSLPKAMDSVEDFEKQCGTVDLEAPTIALNVNVNAD